MQLKWLTLLLLPATSLAGEIPGLPSINEVPMFWGICQNDPRMREAAFKAQEAFLIQTGFMAQYSMITGYISNKVTVVAKMAEHEVADAIDKHTPVTHQQVFFAAATGYSVFVKKSITQRFRNPIFRSVTHTVTLAQDHGSAGVEIPF